MMTHSQQTGIVSAGHPLTAEAAAEVLRSGGNAYDAAIAAHFMACVAEPVLASVGGGGFLLAQPTDAAPIVFDFFVQTPKAKRPPDDCDFRPIVADFGGTEQEFHIGLGAIATPGCVAGMFEVHRRLGTMPMSELVQPAIDSARSGVALNALQAYIYRIVAPILTATQPSRALFSKEGDGELLGEGDVQFFPALADTLEILAKEGQRLFYEGEIAQLMIQGSEQGGGHLRRQDLAEYRVVHRAPLKLGYRGHQVLTNPPPSSGGILIAFALQLLERCKTDPALFGSFDYLQQLSHIMAATNSARLETHLNAPDAPLSEKDMLDSRLLERYRLQVQGRARAVRGTTQVSIIDRWGNAASMTLSNGEGCGSLVPGTGIMLNNMLGEEDLNPGGFHRWQENQRMTSMMAPSVINEKNGGLVVLGSGGSNRIRTAVLQVILNRLDFGMDLDQAVNSPRIHYENGLLNIEPGFAAAELEPLCREFAKHKLWDGLNLFFGGVHSVSKYRDQFSGAGDVRRGGVVTRVSSFI